LRGKFKSSATDGTSIGAYNVPQGSVVVTAGGRVLIEGIDCSINYIGYQNFRRFSSEHLIHINVSVENNLFWTTNQTFMVGLKCRS
jgi:cell surface protein SprA